MVSAIVLCSLNVVHLSFLTHVHAGFVRLTLLKDSVREYKRRNKLGRFADKPEVEAYDYKQEADAIALGSRCEVELDDGGLKRRGVVRFSGLVKFKPGYWIGVEYDEPLGKHDGM